VGCFPAGPDLAVWHAAEDLLCRGYDLVFVRAEGPDFDYPKFAEPFRNTLRENAERLAAENGMEIEFLRKRNVRKEDRVKAVLAKRGDHPGLVCILSAMEACSTYKPWHNKNTGKTYLLPDDGKCLHYYFYFIDEDLGWATCGCQPGCRAGCKSTSTVTVGWPA